MRLCNSKASVIFKNHIETPKKVNNLIFRHNSITFTIYRHTPYLVNVTGVKNLEQLSLVKKIIEEKVEQQVHKVRIDNTFFAQKNFANVDLNQVYTFMKNSDIFYVYYHIELFAGMYFHPKKEYYATILFFCTGSYRMMVGKDGNI